MPITNVEPILDPSCRRGLFAPIEPYHVGRLKVSALHEIYFEQSGNPHGKPVLVVHGGPGGGSSPVMRRFHDPADYRIILFDQRGCGKSTPHAELEENTTWDLVADMERIREHLGIDRWQLYGGSWGSTLSLAYAETHPERVTELLLRGIFTLRRKELLWFYQSGADHVFPEAFAPYRELIPPDERHDMIAAYRRRLIDPDRSVQLAAAKTWSTWEGSALSLLPDPSRVAAFAEDDFAIAFARIENHYFTHRGFFERDDQLLANAHRIADIPGLIVHGRYDMCTPVFIACDLHAVWPRADFRIVPDAGHTAIEPGIVHEIVTASEKFKTYLG